MKDCKLSSLIDSLKKEPYIRDIFDAVYSNKSISVSNLQGSALALTISMLIPILKKPIIFLSDNNDELEKLYNDTLNFLDDNSPVFFLPKINLNFNLDAFFYDQADILNLYRFISFLYSKYNFFLFSHVENLNLLLPDNSYFITNSIKISINDIFPRDRLISHLKNFGYKEVDFVEMPFSFSKRGYILDIYPPHYDFPVRIEYFGDEIVSIRFFSPENQKTFKSLNLITIYPQIKSDKKHKPFFELLPKISLPIINHKERLYNKNLSELLKKFSTLLFINDLSDGDIIFPFDYPDEPLGFNKFLDNLSRIFKKNSKSSVFIFVDSDTLYNSISNNLKNYQFFDRITFIRKPISDCFFIPHKDIYFYSSSSIFFKRKSTTHRKLPSFIENEHLSPIDLDSIEYGDYIVHMNYGIGKFECLEKINAFGTETECLVLKYKGGDKLFVPIDQLNLITKYYASGNFKPTLTKLGSGEWERIKSTTKKSAEKFVKELLELYSRRLNSKGFPFSPDSDLQIQLESEFPFEETPDQTKAIVDVKKDMEKSYPMDRLLCGDVGFGKTEVAIRAAFKAVMDSKQVAVIVPTTILAEQHYRTFSERLKNYPINIAVLSRFTPSKEQKRILSGLSSGTIDIVIGTHRLLSKDVLFKDLGLVIIDEEHLFGVKQKEHFKKIRLNVDVLSLSATPIPRTLYLSLIGAKNISVINTPPKYRYPIHTEIITFDSSIIKEAIRREIDRGGQVYFVTDKIITIDPLFSKLKMILPNVRIDFIHSKLPARKIEQTMLDFINKKIDILITTPIIESGIDLPNVNTIFINRAHNFGLAQLYQLRGRVGRGTRKAYAYLIVNNPARLTDSAMKRLLTLKKFTSLGSGYQIALKDMEVRGAGNVFGVEQSGFINAVGYELYIRILKSCINEFQDSKSFNENLIDNKTSNAHTEVIFPYPAYIPDDYIENEAYRIYYYKKFSNANSLVEVDMLFNDIKDKYGNPRREVKNLSNLFKIKCLSTSLNISKILINKNTATITLSPNSILFNFDINNILYNLTNELHFTYKFSMNENHTFIIYSKKEIVNLLIDFLLKLHNKLNLQ
ncbi:MAG: transcription-repair coupling factor [Candidatus Marinimicrobia bacterium]|nr:transcription-repair coupling factor [Candidatus Neomarinimicrobiota bacterium]